MFSVLYVDDEPVLLELARTFLEQSGEFRVDVAISATEAMEVLGTRSFDAIVSDYQMPVMDGIEFLKNVRSAYGTLPFILFTGKGREEIVIQALNEGADFYLQKGGDPKSQFAELAHKIRQAVSQRQTAQALRKSRQQYLSLIENANEAIFVVQDNMFRMANPKLVELCGYSEQELTSLPMTRFVHTDDRARIRDHFERRLKGEAVPSRLTVRLLRKDESTSWVELNGIAMTWNGRPATLVFLNDINERKQAEDALKASEEQSQKLLSSMPDIVLVHQDGIIVYANQMAEDKTGFSRDELIGSHLADHVVPGDRERVAEIIRQRIAGNAGSDYEIDVVDKSGNVHHVIVRSAPIVFNQKPSVVFVLDDITRQRKAEETLRESEEKYRFVVENSHDAIYIHADDRLLFVNSRASVVTGYTVDELLKMDLWDLVHPDDRRRLKEAAKRRFSGEAVSPYFTARILLKSGEAKEGEFFVDFVIFHGKPAILGIFRDITEQQKTERTLRESEEKYRILLHESHDPIFSFYPDGTYRYVNKAFADGVGKTVDEIIGKKIWDVFSRDEADKRFGPLSRVFATGIEDVIEVRVPRPDGDRYYITTITPIKDDAGAVISAICSSKEITGRKRAEEALRESEEKFRSFVENANEIVFSLSPVGVFLYVSPKVSDLLGYDPGELVGTPAGALLHPDDYSHNREVFLTTVTTAKRMSGCEFRLRHKNGAWQWFSQSISPVLDAGGRVVAVQGIGQDITEQRNAQEAIRRANHQLNLLTGITRHDIRNQIHSLQTYLELSKHSLDDAEKTAEFIRKKEQAAAAIERQIAFMTEYQDLGMNAPMWQDVDAAVHNALSLESLPGIRVSTEGNGIEVYADPLFERVFFNLLDNSLRHGQHVSAIRVSSHESEEGLVVVWEDNGVGIAAGDKERIFERGFGKHTGFGLFLAREILSLTGITIAETGEPGTGARFEIVVPPGGFRTGGSHKKGPAT